MGISEFFEAQDVETIARDLIELHHPMLKLARIRYLATTKEKKVDGEIMLAWTKKLDPVAGYLSGSMHYDMEEDGPNDAADFVIVVDKYRWARLSDTSKRRTIHHELMRIHGSPVKWTLREHDFDGFFQELKLYGTWRYALREAADALQQQELPLEAVTS